MTPRCAGGEEVVRTTGVRPCRMLTRAVTTTYQRADLPGTRPGVFHTSTGGRYMAEGRHRLEDKRPPPEEPREGPSKGVTWSKLAAEAVGPWLTPLLKVIDWALNRRW
jgi:hypothetical protein